MSSYAHILVAITYNVWMTSISVDWNYVLIWVLKIVPIYHSVKLWKTNVLKLIIVFNQTVRVWIVVIKNTLSWNHNKYAPPNFVISMEDHKNYVMEMNLIIELAYWHQNICVGHVSRSKINANVNQLWIFVIMIKAASLFYVDHFYLKKHVYRQKDVNGV